MGKVALGILSGVALGLLDGVSAFLNPDAAPMLGVIIISATVKGLLTGGAVGFVARRLEGLWQTIAAGAAIGAVLSVLAAIPSGSFIEIVPTGTIVGLLAGLIVAKWGQ